jgi:hypothetical protein
LREEDGEGDGVVEEMEGGWFLLLHGGYYLQSVKDFFGRAQSLSLWMLRCVVIPSLRCGHERSKKNKIN